jgi:hypothetical protein
MRSHVVSAGVFLLVSGAASASDRECLVDRKFNVNGEVSQSELAHWQFTVRIVELNDTVILQRCSFSSAADQVTCDSYPAEHVSVSPGFAVTKYYSLFHQFDVQVWPDGQFIENNGRGSIAFGHCDLMARGG